MNGISVVVPVYNGAAFLDEALASVAAQTLAAAEIVVVDDGSTDGSADVAARHAGVRIVQQENAGCATARNRGVAEARHPVIAFLDHDDIWHPERLARAKAVLDADATCGFVACAQRNFLTPGLGERPAWVAPAMLEHPQHGFATNALMVRRAVFDLVGTFDRAREPMDDSDWLCRALDAGIRYVHLDEPLVHRRIHGGNQTGAVRGTAAHGAMMAAILHASLKRRRAAGGSR
ncbi:MAG: glycosyltransferase family 2 protein [Proteobacteria bacterium]|nr:glycosyltransferase family 2 protein [Pseudomonadota bacterium]